MRQRVHKKGVIYRNPNDLLLGKRISIPDLQGANLESIT